MRSVWRAAAVLLVGLAATASAEGPEPDARIVYAEPEGGDLELHVFRPAGWKPSDERPAIVFFFGGGWTGGAPPQFYPHARHFADRGLVAISAQYRTKTSHGVDPFACIADGKAAIRWVREHAAALGVDPARVVAGGGSAGGHVAASTAFLEDPAGGDEDAARPVALMLFNPVIDTTEKGYGAEKVAGRELDASPVHRVRPGAPPTIIFHGTADTTVPFENVERFERLMREAGNRCELVRYEGEKHGFFNYARNPEIYADTIEKADDFLESLGLLE